MSRVTNGNLAVLSAGGVNLMTLVKNVRWIGETLDVDGAPMPNPSMSAQAMSLGGRLEIGAFSTKSAPTRVSHLDISAVTVDSVDLVTMFKRGSFEASYTIQEGKAAGSVWKVPVVTKKDFTLRLEFMIPLSGTANALRSIVSQHLSGTVTDLNMTVTVTINSVSFTLPCLLVGAEVGGSDGELTMVTLELKGRAPDVGTTYPTAPTGTTTLIEKAINAPGIAVAFSFTPHSASGEGANIAGNAVFGAFGFDFNADEIINERYTLLSTGAVTQTNAS